MKKTNNVKYKYFWVKLYQENENEQWENERKKLKKTNQGLRTNLVNA